MSKPRIADLFCGAGGAAMGLHRAGFEVVGYDIKPMPRYPFEFHQQDALTVDLSGFDAVWASPPCQRYSIMRNLPWLKGREWWDSIPPTRMLLKESGLPYILENVMGAKLEGGWLCGTMFGLPVYKHRAFETHWFWLQPGHPKHRMVIKAGNYFGANGGRLVMESRLMGIDWMTRAELTQAIPPAYSEFLGKQLMAYLEAKFLEESVANRYLWMYPVRPRTREQAT